MFTYFYLKSQPRSSEKQSYVLLTQSFVQMENQPYQMLEMMLKMGSKKTKIKPQIIKFQGNRNDYIRMLQQTLVDLTPFNNFVAFKLFPRTDKPGKTDKVPIDPMTGYRAKVNDSKTWSSFERAAECFLTNPKMYGLGFMFGESVDKKSGFVGVDLDNHFENGRLSDFGNQIVNQLNSYTELSLSGTGIHTIVKGELPVGWRKKDSVGVEMYDCTRFFRSNGPASRRYGQEDSSTTGRINDGTQNG